VSSPISDGKRLSVHFSLFGRAKVGAKAKNMGGAIAEGRKTFAAPVACLAGGFGWAVFRKVIREKQKFSMKRPRESCTEVKREGESGGDEGRKDVFFFLPLAQSPASFSRLPRGSAFVRPYLLLNI